MKQQKLGFEMSTKKRTSSQIQQEEKNMVNPLSFFAKKVEQKPGIVKKSKYFDEKEKEMDVHYWKRQMKWRKSCYKSLMKTNL